MADIKTRDAVKGTIKTIDKAAVASERMKSAYSKIKSKAEQGYYADENSATEYAADKVSAASERITDEGVHQFNKQGQKGVKTTKDNVVKAKGCDCPCACNKACHYPCRRADWQSGLQNEYGCYPADAVHQQTIPSDHHYDYSQ